VSFFRLLRITALLTLLVVVAGTQWLTQTRIGSWEKPIWLTIYPIVADAGATTARYAEDLEAEAFADIGGFLGREAGRYGRDLQAPLALQMAPVSHALPPSLPPADSRLATAVWSLRMRWWAWRRDREDGLPGADVQVFVLYRGTEGTHMLDRSVGTQKGMYGIVNAYASRASAPRNRVVVAHELLHILGATDKYDPSNGQPLVPGGLADPDRRPPYPQEKAEIMGGRIAVSPNHAVMPESLRSCVIGRATAAEIGWL
jgi:hypothetical protein